MLSNITFLWFLQCLPLSQLWLCNCSACDVNLNLGNTLPNLSFNMGQRSQQTNCSGENQWSSCTYECIGHMLTLSLMAFQLSKTETSQPGLCTWLIASYHTDYIGYPNIFPTSNHSCCVYKFTISSNRLYRVCTA